MPDQLEEQALSGKLFEPSRDSDEERINSTPNTDDELFGSSASSGAESPGPSYAEPSQSIGMGPGRTGVKGVIRDHNEAKQIARARKQADVETTRKQLQKSSLLAGAKTFGEEERQAKQQQRRGGDPESAEDEQPETFRRKQKLTFMMNDKPLSQARNPTVFGHLREIAPNSFADAVDGAPHDVPVVIHVHDSRVDRCKDLDMELVPLARTYTSVKFIRVRAAGIGFANIATSPKVDNTSRVDNYDEEWSDEEAPVDLDMLPTLLVYRNGELLHNWVRVDFELGASTLQDFLSQNGVLASGGRHGDRDASD